MALRQSPSGLCAGHAPVPTVHACEALILQQAMLACSVDEQRVAHKPLVVVVRTTAVKRTVGCMRRCSTRLYTLHAVETTLYAACLCGLNAMKHCRKRRISSKLSDDRFIFSSGLQAVYRTASNQRWHANRRIVTPSTTSWS